MGLIVILPLTWVTIWGTYSIHRWLVHGTFGEEWMRRFWICGGIGLVVGLVFAFGVHYQVANAQIRGFPIPVGMNNREKPGEPWMPDKMPLAISLAARLTDLMSGVALCLVPIAVSAFLKENRSANPQSIPANLSQRNDAPPKGGA